MRALACIALLLSLSSPTADLNAARTAHGLQAGVPTNAYTRQVDIGLARHGDPPLPLVSGFVEEFALWGRAQSVQAVINDWVARDGFRGSATLNVNCPTPNSRGCNVHREAVLSSEPHARLLIDIKSARVGRQVEVVAILVWVRK